MLLLGALLVLAQAPAGYGSDSLRSELVHQRHGCLPVEISSARESPRRAGRSVRRRGAFSASRSLDLIFQTRLRRRLQGEHTVEFRLRAPRGFLYQSLAVPVTPASAAETGSGHRARVPPSRRSRPALTATLPVAGTAITTNSLYGRWSVEPLLDGAPCGPTHFFSIRP